ncbi:sulfhydryl oxidase 1-like [Branchiostoma floridae]|uniref:Sulfhydryl oxidase n=2 Tax=Branchiostoma floridae TaxID=7739 RepID=A0A9J7LJE6_BRAFL|nr:sulfhydryl oxidase 1-like [Branchiostoma floridae]
MRFKMAAGVYVFFVSSVVCLLFCLSFAELYSEEDAVVRLDAVSLNRTIYNVPNVFLVEFYSSWCGHCVNFAPTWKALARDTQDWAEVIQLAAIDCADSKNLPTCRQYDIKGYPTIKVFQPFTQNTSDIGKPLKVGRASDKLVHAMVDVIEQHSLLNKPQHWPNLQPAHSSEVSEFFQTWKNVEYLALLFEANDSYVGKQVILDMAKHDNIMVRRVLKNEEMLMKKLAVEVVPSLYVLYRNGSAIQLARGGETRFDFRLALKKLPHLDRSQRHGEQLLLQPSAPTLEKTTAPRTPSMDNFNRSAVHMTDLLSALTYSFKQEIAGRQELEGQTLQAVQDFVKVLAKYFPGPPGVSAFLHNINRRLNPRKTKMTYQEWAQLLDEQEDASALPQEVRWVGCQGSQPHGRGYSCSLWLLFHTLTVQQAAEPDPTQNSQSVLLAMRAYITTMFGCQECGKNFQKEAVTMETDVATPDEAVLWLWRTHNRVNKRLHGDLSEDPQFPKVQFPPPWLCPSCHLAQGPETEPVWDEGQVLQFLKRHYGSANFIHDNPSLQSKDQGPHFHVQPTMVRRSDPRQPHKQTSQQELVGVHVKDLQGRLQRRHDPNFGIKVEKLPGNENRANPSGWGFSNLDISMCVMLYVLSSGLVVGLYVMFIVKRRRRRRTPPV